MTTRAARLKREAGRIGRFSVTGVANTAVDMAVFATMTFAVGLAPVPSNLIAYGAGVTNSYLMNRYWTFRHDAPDAMGPGRIALFFGLNTLVAGTATLALYLLMQAGAPAMVAKLLSVLASMGLNYAAMRRVVFARRDPSTAEGRG